MCKTVTCSGKKLRLKEQSFAFTQIFTISNALHYIINNRNFKVGSDSQNELVNSLGNLIDNSFADYNVINSLSNILNVKDLGLQGGSVG